MFHRSGLLASAFALFAVPALAQTSWDMPTPYADAVFHTQNIRAFADEVRELTGGSLDITVHSAGSLFGHAEIKDSVRRGLAPIGEILMSRLGNENPIFEVDSIPFLANNYGDSARLFVIAEDRIRELLAEQGLTLLYAVPWPGQSLFLRAPVTEPSELRGVTFRAYNTAMERMAGLLGMVPTQVEAGDIPTAFSTGRVAAMMTSPSTGVSSQAWDYTSHYIDVQAWLPYNIVFVNTRAFEALSEDERLALINASETARQRGLDMSIAETATQIAALEANGMVIMQPSEALSARLAEVGAEMAVVWEAQAGEAGAAILNEFRGN